MEEESFEPFTDEDLKAIFLSDEYRRQRETNPPRYWLPMGLLLTGARREEISNLAVGDVKEETIPYLDVVKDRTRARRLKTKQSRRVIPIHSTLIEKGFLLYVEQCRVKNWTILFPNERSCSKAPTGGDTISKWFTRLLKEKGITGKKALKSFRPTFTTRLHEAGVDGETRRQLTGHAGKDIHEIVYLRPQLSVLKTAVEKLKFEWLV